MQYPYKVTPGELCPARSSVPGGVTLRLSFRPPHQRTALWKFLSRRAIPGVEEVRGNAYRRSIRFGDRIATMELAEATGDAFTLTILSEEAGRLAEVVQRSRRILNLDAVPELIDSHLAQSPLLAPLVAARPGLRLPGAFDVFELGVRAILGQQVTVAAATTTAGRFAAMFGTRIRPPLGAITTLFPTPREVATADFRQLGVPRRRAEAISAFAAAVADGSLPLDGSIDPAEIQSRLIELPGVGPWTAAYIAMRGFRNPDAFPATDLGLQRALEKLGVNGPRHPGLADAWRPWRGYAAMHLWESLQR